MDSNAIVSACLCFPFVQQHQPFDLILLFVKLHLAPLIWCHGVCDVLKVRLKIGGGIACMDSV